MNIGRFSISILQWHSCKNVGATVFNFLVKTYNYHYDTTCMKKLMTKPFNYRQAILVLFLCCFSAIGGWAQDVDTLRENAVLAARQGQNDEAVKVLRTLLDRYPENVKVLSDFIVVLLWNNESQEALQLYQQQSFSFYPAYVHAAVIDYSRRAGETNLGLKTVDYLVTHYPDELGYQLKKAQLLIDANRHAEARLLLDWLRDIKLDSIDLNRVYAYLDSSESNWVGALQDYQYILSVNPQDKEAVTGQDISLLRLNAPFAAGMNRAESDKNVQPQDQAYLLYTKAALYLRWSGFAATTQEESLFFASQALLLQLQAQSLLAPEDDLQKKISQDMVISYKNLRLYDQSYILYSTLAEDYELPAYVIQGAADSLLGLKEPGLAQDLYLKVLALEADNYQAKLSLFYSYIESENYTSAYQLVEDEQSRQVPFSSFAGSGEQIPNDRYLDMAVLSGQARLYGDQLQEAWDSIVGLVHNAPANDWLVQVAGETAQARGWPRKAHEYFQAAVLLNNENNDALAGKGQSRLQLRDFDGAEAVVSQLKQEYPLSESTMQLEEDIYWSRRPDLWADIVFSYSEGPEQSGDGILATTELISSPLSNTVFLSAFGRYNWTEIPEGHESLFRVAGGLEYITDPLDILAQVNYNVSTLEEVGALLRAAWTPDDHWLVSFQGELFSDATPLRALYYGIRADKVSGSVQYRWHETRLISFSASSALFTDDNERFELGASFAERLIDIPRFDLDARVEIFSSTNSRDDAPYYNPEADFSIKGIGRAEHVLFRHYDNSVIQRLDLGVGMYAQKNYESGLTSYLRYEQRYSFYPRFEAVVGGEIGSNMYDGQSEPYYQFNFLIHAKF